MAMHQFSPMGRFFDPMTFGTELIYTVIIVVLCFLVYFKTREIYGLTKHKGIQFFRHSFLFFGLAYASRLFLHFHLIGRIAFDFIVPRREFMPICILVVGYLGTMALLYLAYSTIWKKIKSEHFLLFSNIVALIISLASFFSRNPFFVPLIQFFLLIFIIIVNIKRHGQIKKGKVRALYLLVAFFWLFNLFILGPTRLIPFEIQITLQIISLAVFVLIYYKVHKWIK